jgi:hypothetical protein
MSRRPTSAPPPPPKPEPKQIHINDAVTMLASKVNRLETLCGAKFKGIESKIGDHESKFIESTPDLDRFAEMFSNFNLRLNELSDRLATMERANNVKPPKKKGGTVMLTELEPTADVSFSS